MKLFFSILIIFFLAETALTTEIYANYTIKAKGIKIGSLTWEIKLNEDSYETNIGLKSEGFLSMVYSFKGDYSSVGIIKKDSLIPIKYFQSWKTKKKDVEVKIFFEKYKIKELLINPVEKESARIDYKGLFGYSDPLTSFISILQKNEPSYTTDGRRAYLLFPDKNEKSTKILIKEYKNIWADHKRNKLEFIEVFNKTENLFPKKIQIGFDGMLFVLTKN
jgi:hypothetical protein